MIAMSNLGETLIIHSFDAIQILLKIYVDFMIDSVIRRVCEQTWTRVRVKYYNY